MMGQVCDDAVRWGILSMSSFDAKPVYTYPVDIPTAYPANKMMSTATLGSIFSVLDSGLSLKAKVMT
jgi:hypothetical protein